MRLSRRKPRGTEEISRETGPKRSYRNPILPSIAKRADERMAEQEHSGNPQKQVPSDAAVEAVKAVLLADDGDSVRDSARRVAQAVEPILRAQLAADLEAHASSLRTLMRAAEASPALMRGEVVGFSKAADYIRKDQGGGTSG